MPKADQSTLMMAAIWLMGQCSLHGGKVIAGGYNKATARMGAAPPNRFLIVQWPSKEASDKSWTEYAQKWWDSGGSKYASDFRDIGVEGIEQK